MAKAKRPAAAPVPTPVQFPYVAPMGLSLHSLSPGILSRKPPTQSALVRALVAATLLELYPAGPPPGKQRADLADEVRAAAGKTIGPFEMRTFDRARALAWPRSKRQGG
jgi:hypothetical protein